MIAITGAAGFIGSNLAHRLANHEGVLMREGELMSKLHDLLHSPVGAGVARILDDLHGLIPRARHSG